MNGTRRGCAIAGPWRGVLGVLCAFQAAACLRPAFAEAASKQPTRRSFRLGFTPFPHDFTVKALTEVRQFVRENADIIAVHLEGVPWREARTDKPFHEKMLENWARHKAARPDGGKLYLALTPINNDRSDLASYRSQREHLPMPPAFVGKSFDDPLVMNTYLKYCRRAVAYFRPDYLAVGIEVNELYHKAKEKWPAYVRLQHFVYRSLKREHPKLPIFATFTLHNMLNPGWSDRREMLAAFKKLMIDSDVVGVSFYPFMANLTGRTDRSLRWLTREFDGFRKPYALCEVGQPAEPLVLKSLKITLPGSEVTQHRALSAMLSFAGTRRVEFVIWFVPRDYDALWEKMKPTAPEFFKAWRDCGLLDGDGHPRPACRLWQEARKLPHRPPPPASTR
jgi:hypothetical protein